MAKGVLVDITRCIGCRSCQIACKAWHNLEAGYEPFHGTYTMPNQLSADTYTRIEFMGNEKGNQPSWSFVKNQCLHCHEPACASACPVGALQKTDEGSVVYDQWKCIGCRYCMIACPFHIPKYEWDTLNPWIQKCTFCADRVEAGMEPACVKACPMHVMYFDDYEKVVQEAKARIKNYPGKYVNHIYGLDEAGGTSWIYIADRPFAELGFDTQVAKAGYPSFTWASLSKIPWKAVGFAAALTAIAAFRNRGSRKEDV
ncbi:MAG: 4Fe-4S dicluster domain-containing protein [Desulfovermiculus sp.]